MSKISRTPHDEIIGPESVLDGSVAVFDGISGKAVRAGTGNISDLTIDAGGAIAITAGRLHTIDTFSGAGTDDLTSITGGVVDQEITLMASDDTHDVVVKDQGTLHLAGDFTLANVRDTIRLVCTAAGSTWSELSRSNNA